MPPATTQRARDIGVGRIISRRPSVSSDAHFATKVAPAKPAAMYSSSRVELEPAARRREVEAREDGLRRSSRAAGRCPIWSANAPDSDASSAPDQAEADRPRRAPAAAGRRTRG